MLAIPVQAIAAQTINVVLGKQNCQITLTQKSTGLYFDLLVNGIKKVSTRLIRNGVPLVHRKYLGVVGDFMVLDMQGTSDPEYAGLGSRFQLAYIEAYEL